MIRKIVIPVLLFSFLLGCQSAKIDEAKLFYDRLHLFLDKAEKSLNELGDSTISINQQLMVDPGYIPDTVHMREILISATTINSAISDSINSMNDPEPAIGVKQAALNYTRLWNEMLENEYRTWLKELSEVKENKAVHFQQLLEPKLTAIQESSNILTIKSKSFRKTYEF
jgi:hypothetical protein